jgi:ABC-type Mn2+/Zn2+ transport system permease subunit
MSLNFDLPPGATIVISLASLFIIALVIKNIKQVFVKPVT